MIGSFGREASPYGSSFVEQRRGSRVAAPRSRWQVAELTHDDIASMESRELLSVVELACPTQLSDAAQRQLSADDGSLRRLAFLARTICRRQGY